MYKFIVWRFISKITNEQNERSFVQMCTKWIFHIQIKHFEHRQNNGRLQIKILIISLGIKYPNKSKRTNGARIRKFPKRVVFRETHWTVMLVGHQINRSNNVVINVFRTNWRIITEQWPSSAQLLTDMCCRKWTEMGISRIKAFVISAAHWHGSCSQFSIVDLKITGGKIGGEDFSHVKP